MLVRRLIGAGIAFPALLFAVAALAQSGGAYSLTWSVLAGGGATQASTGGAYVVSGTTGQSSGASQSGGAYALSGGFWYYSPTSTAVELPGDPGPGNQVFNLEANAPNPFRSRTSLAFTLAKAAPTRVIVYDVRGRKVRTLVEGPLPPGRYQVTWNGRDDAGQKVSVGIYLLRLDSGAHVATRKLMVLR